MTRHEIHADRAPAASFDPRPRRRIRALATCASRTLHLTVADAVFAYASTGSAFATVMVLAAPHLEMLLRCIFHGRG
jgi:hypothetical protein